MLAQGTILRSRYRIIKHLGSGGFGDTYFAEDSDLPRNSQCVVKHLKPTSTKPQVLAIARRLFKTEAQVLDDLGSHDQIPKLLAYFEENEEFYLVQELVNGHDLSKELTPGKRFSKDEVMKLLHDILEVLAVVHQQNIIHRDIKPQNIMRRRIDEKIVLIDFGAVKEIQNLGINAQSQVKSTIAVGTPGYMPSEQAKRRPQLNSDVYAVGMIGIQALTGLLPEQLPEDSTTDELIFKPYVDAEVSDDVMEVLTKMVRHDFRDRYQSATEALEAVNALIPQQVHPFTPVIPQAPKSVMRGCLIGLGGLGAGIVATIALLLNIPQPQNDEPITAPSPITNSTIPTPEPITTESPITNSTIPTLTPPPLPPSRITFAIAPQFDDAYGFAEGLARVKVGAKWGYIDDKTGNRVIPPQFDTAGDFSEGLARVEIGKKVGYINKEGNLVIPSQFDGANDFSEGLAGVTIGEKTGYINKAGNLVIPPQFDGVGDFSEGLARVTIGKKTGYIDKTGNLVIPPQFDGVGDFSEGLARVTIGKKTGYIDKTGNLVIPLQFDAANDFSEGLAGVTIGKKIGYIDKAGNLVIPSQFDGANDFSEGLAGVTIGEKTGYINKAGNLVIPPQFDGVRGFSEGLAGVTIGEKTGYIDKTGNRVVALQFYSVGSFSKGLAWVQESSGKKIGYIRNPLK